MERYSTIVISTHELNQLYFSRENRKNQIAKLCKEKQPRHKNDVWKLDEGNALVQTTSNYRAFHDKETFKWKNRIQKENDQLV